MGRPRKSAQAAAVDNTAVLDVKPIKTLAPMFPAALGFHTATPGPNSPNFMCVTPFGAPNAESGSNPPGFTPGQMPPPMFFMGGAGAAGAAGVTTPAVPPVLKSPKSKKTPAGSTGQGKKRRGRPRKSEAATVVTPVQIVSPPASTGQGKRGRGRPRKIEQIVA